jgi:4-amino-4-deoxy-L-arabinose transferase-like glycosyltransferase
MRNTLAERISERMAERKPLSLSRQQILEGIGLAAIVALAAVLLFSNLNSLGYANTYYTAAVKSMLQSWHNFFFVAAEPGGSVSVDKPPLGFWLQTISAYFLGVNGFAVVLPQIIAGLLSIVVLYHLVRRRYGAIPGLLAALALAITPVFIATNRNNTIDGTLVLALLLAAWAFIKATETGRLRFLLIGAALVGVGFNIKMLEAYLPLPAFYALYFLGASASLRAKVGRLALATAVLLVVSFSWAVAVDLTPASQRPFVGSSGDNSEISLILGYNGVNRLLGMAGLRRGASASAPAIGGFPPPQGAPQGGFGQPGRSDAGGQPPAGFPALGQTGGARTFGGAGGPGGFGGFGGFMGTGTPGALRLFSAPLSNEMSWLLPIGLLGGLLVIIRNRLRWPLGPDHQAVVLWGGWLLTGGVFFSIAGFFHQYYLTMLAPPLAALVGIGAFGLWQLHKERPWLACGLLGAGAVGTLAFQAITARAFTSSAGWLLPAAAVLIIGMAALAVAALRRLPRAAAAGFACVAAALLVTPGIWSGLTTFDENGNQSMPAAYSGASRGFDGGFGRRSSPTSGQPTLTFLEQHTQGMEYLVAVPSAMQGDEYVLATGRPVLFMGGFSGQDQVVTPESLSQLIAQGRLRYVELGGNGFGGRGQSDISSWVTGNCKLVQTGLYDCKG